MWLKILPIILLTACASTGNKNMTENKSDLNRLHDIWALHSMDGESLPLDIKKTPVLEIFVSTKRIVGNDGCNNVSAPLKTLNENEIHFGPMMGTKMACPNMAFTRTYNIHLVETRFYTLKGLKLVLLDENKEELMVFKKVD